MRVDGNIITKLYEVLDNYNNFVFVFVWYPCMEINNASV